MTPEFLEFLGYLKWGESSIIAFLPLKAQGERNPFSWLPSLKNSCPVCFYFLYYLYLPTGPFKSVRLPVWRVGLGRGGEEWDDTFLVNTLPRSIWTKSNSTSLLYSAFPSLPAIRPQSSPVINWIHIILFTLGLVHHLSGNLKYQTKD